LLATNGGLLTRPARLWIAAVALHVADMELDVAGATKLEIF
jgi:hypothetical protein